MARSISRIAKVSDRTGLGKSTIYAKVANGDFPKPVKLGPKASGWFDDEVDAWLEERAAERDEAAA